MNKPLNNFLDIFEDEIKFSNNYKKCLNHFIKTLKENQMKYYKELDYKLYINNPEKISIKTGLKYDKVIIDNRVLCFIEISTGNIYKPANWSTPYTKGKTPIRASLFNKSSYINADINGGWLYK